MEVNGEMPKSNYLTFTNRKQWRMWLEQHHATEQKVWVVHYKKKYQDQGLTLDEAVEEALCFGWIDGTLRSIDDMRYVLRYSPRKKNSIWSLSNIKRVEKLISEGKMTDAGLMKIAEAHENGEWDAAIRRECIDSIPEELMHALCEKEGAFAAYQAISNSRKKQFIYWLQSAKREETRNSRIQKILDEILER
jgi:uncharacterized protein YdeI (YjbR/CyaY-like superfamily)